VICGHDRETLQWALAISRETDVGKTVLVLAGHRQGKHAKVIAHDAVHDPAKLAAIIAELLRSYDVGAGCHATADGIMLWEPRTINGHGRLLGKQSAQLTMPQARTFALRLLDAPTATAQDIERMIGEL
jgi:hypothetical protein